jgi:hypothetical protein
MGDHVFLVVSGDEMKTLLVFTVFLSATTSSAQSTYNEKEWRETLRDLDVAEFLSRLPDVESSDCLCSNNEKLIFGFRTVRKILSICVSSDLSAASGHVIYRFGKPGAIEMQFPSDPNQSLTAFTYEHYFRGGGAENEGLDLNSLTFTNSGFVYEVYDHYIAESDTMFAGVRITNLSSGKKTDIPAASRAIGSLRVLDEFGLVPQKNE